MDTDRRSIFNHDGTPLELETRRHFLRHVVESQMLPFGAVGTKGIEVKVMHDIWAAKAAKATYVVDAASGDQSIYGPDLSLSEDEVVEIEDAYARKVEPDKGAHFADPGYQPDGKKRYPIDNEAHIRAALSYFSQEKNQSAYTPAQRKKIMARIIAAYKRVIDPKGPPSQQDK